MNYLVLSATQSENCPISLVEDAILYSDKEQANSSIEPGSLPWYSYKTSGDCELPKNGILVLKSKKTKNVCVKIWLHPLHPFFSVQFSVFSLQKKKWQLAFTTFDFFGFIFRIVGWFDLLLRR